MKIADILFETLAVRKIPFDIDYEYEWDDPDRDENLEPFETITVRGYVIITPQAYSVKGSPTGYEVVITDVTNERGGPFDQSLLGDNIVADIKQQAIQQVTDE